MNLTSYDPQIADRLNIKKDPNILQDTQLSSQGMIPKLSASRMKFNPIRADLFEASYGRGGAHSAPPNIFVNT